MHDELLSASGFNGCVLSLVDWLAELEIGDSSVENVGDLHCPIT